MKKIPNYVVNELIRLIPVLIAAVPPDCSLRVANAKRLLTKLTKKLKTLQDEEDRIDIRTGESRD